MVRTNIASWEIEHKPIFNGKFWGDLSIIAEKAQQNCTLNKISIAKVIYLKYTRGLFVISYESTVKENSDKIYQEFEYRKI